MAAAAALGCQRPGGLALAPADTAALACAGCDLLSNTPMPQPPETAAKLPLDLPRLLMRRAAAVGLAVLALALVLGLLRMRADMDDEFAAAQALAGLIVRLGGLATADAATAKQALAEIRLQADQQRPHHLQLLLHDAEGAALLPSAGPVSDAAPMRALLAVHRWLSPSTEARAQSWPLARPDGRAWTITLLASHESERREALLNLLGTLALLLLCVAGLLLVMRWNVRHALAPLDRLLAVIKGSGGLDARALQALPPMPIHELERLAGALRQLGAALADAEGRRRLLGQQVLTLQEDERTRLARELHDEMGQRLTALRVDATWLARRLAGQADLAPVVLGMAEQCAGLQADVRGLLARLRPFEATGDTVSLAQLCQMLAALAGSWRAAGRDGGLQVQLDLPPCGHGLADRLQLPQPLGLALYRISQEALTNVARHARAQQVVLRLACTGALVPGAPVRIDWSVQDDGIGLARPALAQQQGNGLSGIQERVWAQGAELGFGPGLQGRGLGLSAQIHSHWRRGRATADAAVAGRDEAVQ